jgi:hypothetical protein
MAISSDRREWMKAAALLPLAGHGDSPWTGGLGPVSSSIALPLAVAVGTTNVPGGVSNIVTAGYARMGVGAARYVRIAGQAAPGERVLRSRDGASFRLSEAMPTIEMFGADAALADNSAAIQAAVDHAAAGGGGLVAIPPGRYRFARAVNLAAGVHLTGSGTFASELVFAGQGSALNAIGTAAARKACRMSDFSLRAEPRGNTATGVQLGWNQRSGPILAAVRITGFGRFGVEFAASNWLVTLRDVEVTACGANVRGGCGIFRPASAERLADIRLEGVLVEECGNPQSLGGGITFEGSAAAPCQGLWLVDSTVEGNFGQAEMSFAHVDHLSLDRNYFETDGATGKARDVIHTQDCNLTIGNCRIGSAPGKRGRAMVARGSGRISSSSNVWDSDFADPAILMDAAIVEVEGTARELTDVTKGRSGSR